jgi:hypothetical protein
MSLAPNKTAYELASNEVSLSLFHHPIIEAL